MCRHIYRYGLLTATLLSVVCALSQMTAPGVAAPATPAKEAGNKPQASTSTSTFEDWVVRCETKPPASKICEVVQTIAARNQQQQQSAIAEVVFGRVGKSDPMKLIVQVPPGVYLPSGIRLVVDGRTPPLTATFTRCLQTCMAEAEIKPETIQTLKSRTKAEPGRLEFEDGAHQQVKLPVSFKGLPAALAAREEQVQ
jgi:invasion protein IalB